MMNCSARLLAKHATRSSSLRVVGGTAPAGRIAAARNGGGASCFHASPSAAAEERGSGRHGTTIICVRKGDKVCMMGDGMVSQGSMIVKPNAVKIRRIPSKAVPGSSSKAADGASSSAGGGGTLVGFAGSTADAFTLLERLEGKLDEYPGQLARSCVELAKGWRTDKYLRRLEASLIVADETVSLELTGNGDVLESHDGILGVGSGSPYAIGMYFEKIVSRFSTELMWRNAQLVLSLARYSSLDL
jgi:ATP-dependent HslUV protease, peptidase subunit HslV